MDAINRHDRIALQFSGGKDSIAILFLLRDWWHKITIYWVNTGSAFPETIEIIDRVKALVPNFKEVKSDQQTSVRNFGLPSDVVPVNWTPIGTYRKDWDGVLIQNRYECCARVLFSPMYQALMDDGITLVIRGEKSSDKMKGPLKSGQVIDGIEYLFPIEGWEDNQVFDFISKTEIGIPRFYEVGAASFDCIDCSAWGGENRAAYLSKYHPEKYYSYIEKVRFIKNAVQSHLDLMEA